MDMVEVLERLNYQVTYNPAQTCCGQPAFNAGHREEAHSVASCFLEAFKEAECIVCPSGSCVAMVRKFFPQVFQSSKELEIAKSLESKVFEFTEFLVREGKVNELSGQAEGKVAFHNSCHAMRELRLIDEPWAVLRKIEGCQWVQPEVEPTCCGFGGLFSVKFSPISQTMAKTRLEQFVDCGADTLVTNDPGCLQQLKTEASSKSLGIDILHLSQFLNRALNHPGVRS